MAEAHYLDRQRSPAVGQMAVRRRQIEEADLGAVAELFARGFLLRSKSYWLRGFARLRSRSVPAGYSRYGLLLESEGRPVGAILTIYASVPADGAFAIRCNVSS
ncbi:MAG: hypothetical protein WB663_13320 [Beijerinckiaceae bacterium]